MKFTIGCDPELFLQDNKGALVSAVGLIGGTKESPRFISEDGHAVQEDNVSVEFNIPPCHTADAFVANLDFVMSYLTKYASDKGLLFSKLAAASFPEEQLQTDAAQVFGCEPDYNAWTLETNPRPYCDDLNLRSCGGHVHVGTTLDKVQVIRAMDVFLGVPSTFIDTDLKRRQLYGKGGAFRSKQYGVEYRSLSNFWIWEEKLRRWVYEQTNKALEFVQAGNVVTHGEQVQRAINNGDKKCAEFVLQHYGVAYE